MKGPAKYAVGILIAICLLALLSTFLNSYLEKNIKTELEEKLKKANVSFKEVDVNLLDRKAEVIHSLIKIKGKTLGVDTITLNDIGLWEYITNKNIVAGELDIANPVFKIYNLKEKKDTASGKKSDFKKELLLKNVNIRGGSLQLFEKDSSQHKVYAKIERINLGQVQIDSVTLKKTIPFDYNLMLFNADSIFYDLDEQHEMTAGDLQIDSNQVFVKDFRILPKFSKSVHQKTTPVEKDRYDLHIDSISMDNFNWSKNTNDSLKITNSFTQIAGVNFRIYRDKLQPDDTSTKLMYSQMIRELPVKLQLDSVQVERAYIRYEENIHADRETGVVDFSNLNARIKNISNVGMQRKDFPRTTVDVSADFMKAAPLKVNWEFDISNKNDRFQISGNMGRLAAEQMNQFLKPAMNVEAKGEIMNMFFNFSGYDVKATGDMRLEYNDFKVEVLRKDGKRKNNIISALANLIVKNNAINEKAEYKDISYTRNRTKSFWNYFWNLIKTGALKSFL